MSARDSGASSPIRPCSWRLDEVGWRIRDEGAAAQRLGLNPSTLESRMQKLGIKR